MKIGIPTLHCYDKLFELCSSLSASMDNLEITIIDNGGKLTDDQVFPGLAALSIPVQLITPPFNLGVAVSWNLLIRELGRCIICNDDVLFSHRDVCSFLNAAIEFPDAVILNTADPGNHWSMFFVNRPQKWMDMGGFDETFFPAYFEDNDAFYRLELANLSCKFVALQDFTHDKSSTLRRGNAVYQSNHQSSFLKNAIYYQQKWGGPPGKETFTTPFGI